MHKQVCSCGLEQLDKGVDSSQVTGICGTKQACNGIHHNGASLCALWTCFMPQLECPEVMR